MTFATLPVLVHVALQAFVGVFVSLVLITLVLIALILVVRSSTELVGLVLLFWSSAARVLIAKASRNSCIMAFRCLDAKASSNVHFLPPAACMGFARSIVYGSLVVAGKGVHVCVEALDGINTIAEGIRVVAPDGAVELVLDALHHAHVLGDQRGSNQEAVVVCDNVHLPASAPGLGSKRISDDGDVLLRGHLQIVEVHQQGV
mmetsp:Transcript_51760/g.120296  ORF Transcript_51760/g.120296 Transcript_51760/m.120296 type:complete len:203 (-) Transcript_51760:135-743(-)